MADSGPNCAEINTLADSGPNCAEINTSRISAYWSQPAIAKLNCRSRLSTQADIVSMTGYTRLTGSG